MTEPDSGSTLLGSRFLANVLTVSAGAAAAQVLALAATPILSRLYEPRHFGVLAGYMGIVALLTVVAAGRYEVAIPLPEDDDDAAGLFYLSIGLAFLSSIALLIAVWLFRQDVARWLDAPELAAWLWVAPASLFSASLFETLKYWKARRDDFRPVAAASVTRSLVTVATQIGAGTAAANAGVTGLISGQVAGTAGAAGIIAASVHGDRELLRPPSRSAIAATARRFIQFPRHALSTNFLNTLSLTAVPLILAALLGPVAAGLVLLSLRVVGLPPQIVGQAIWQVTHAGLGRIQGQDRADLVRSVQKYSCYVFAYPLVAIAAFSYFAASVFGSDWDQLRNLIPPLALMVYLASISSSASYFVAFELYRQETWANTVLAGARLGALVVAAVYFEVVGVVVAYALVSSAVYLGIILFWGRRLNAVSAFLRNALFAIVVAALPVAAIRLSLGDSLLPAAGAVILVGALYYAGVSRLPRPGSLE